MPAVLTVSVRAVVLLHCTDGETEAQSSKPTVPTPASRALPLPHPLPQAGADSVSALPSEASHWLMSSPGQPGGQVPTALKLECAFRSR